MLNQSSAHSTGSQARVVIYNCAIQKALRQTTTLNSPTQLNSCAGANSQLNKTGERRLLYRASSSWLSDQPEYLDEELHSRASS